jgi:uncharacterized protein YggE
MTRVVAAVAKLGIPDTDVQTSEYNVTALHPKAKNGEENENKTTGYQITNKATVTIRDLTKLAKVIDAATLAGANSANSIEFLIKDRVGAEDKAKIAAVKDARHQAEVLAAAEGAKVTRMIAITTQNFSSVTYAAAAPPPAILEANQTPILPGQIRIEANVTVQYGVE